MPELLRRVQVRQDHACGARSEKDLADRAIALGMGEEEGRERPVFVEIADEGRKVPERFEGTVGNARERLGCEEDGDERVDEVWNEDADCEGLECEGEGDGERV